MWPLLELPHEGNSEDGYQHVFTDIQLKTCYRDPAENCLKISKIHLIMHLLILLHSERPKLHTILAFLSAIGLSPKISLIWSSDHVSLA